MDDADPGPDEDRVTDPERFAVLHDVARALVDELAATGAVARLDGVDLDADAARCWPGVPATRLEPDEGAPVTVTLTPFPGVWVTYGHGGSEPFPRCGCDRCDEDPATEAARLADLVRAVASGGLTETRTRRRLRADTYEARLDAGDGSGRSVTGGTVDDDPRWAAVPVGTTRWPAWTR